MLTGVFYDKNQIEPTSFQFVAYLITNMIDINCLKTEVHLNTIYKLSSFLTESILLVCYKDQSSVTLNSNLCWLWLSQEAYKQSVRARCTFLNVKPGGIYSYLCFNGSQIYPSWMLSDLCQLGRVNTGYILIFCHMRLDLSNCPSRWAFFKENCAYFFPLGDAYLILLLVLIIAGINRRRIYLFV